MGRRNRLRACAALVALGVLGAAPCAAAADPGTWVPHGKRIEGTPSTAQAPPLDAGRYYSDSLPKDGVRSYAVDLDASSTAYLSAFAIPAATDKVGFLDGISLKLVAADGTVCDSTEATFPGDGVTEPVGGAVRRLITPESTTCRQAGAYFLVVQRKGAANGLADDWRLDIRYLAEPPVQPGQSAAPVPSYASASPSPVTGTPTPVTGAAAMDDRATAVRTGVYRDHLTPGRPVYYQVPVDWGQRLFVTAEFGNAPHLTRTSGFTVAGVGLALYNPARAKADSADAVYTGAPAAVSVQTAPVRYANRGADGKVGAASVAGWYYVQVNLRPGVADYTTGGVDVVLRFSVQGAAEPGPRYAGDLGRAGFGVHAAATPGADDAPVSARTLHLVGFGALGLGTVLLAGLGAWFLAARRGLKRAAGA